MTPLTEAHLAEFYCSDKRAEWDAAIVYGGEVGVGLELSVLGRCLGKVVRLLTFYSSPHRSLCRRFCMSEASERPPCGRWALRSEPFVRL